MRARRLPLYILGADFLWATAALYLAYEFRYGFTFTLFMVRDWFFAFGPALAAALAIWAVLSCVMKLDGFRGGWSFRAVFTDTLVGVFLLMALLLAGGYLAEAYQSRLVLFYFSVLMFAGSVAIRCITRWVLVSRHFAGTVGRVVILGGGRIAKELAARIARHSEMRWEVIGFLCPDEQMHGFIGDAGRPTRSVKTLEILDLLAEKKVHQLILVLPHPGKETLNLIARCRKAGIHVSVVPQSYELYISRPKLAEIDGLPLISLEEYVPPASSQAIKRLVDLLGTPLLLVVFSPILLIATGILCLKKGQAFRRELRCGKDGKTFWMYRLNVDRELRTVPAHEGTLLKLGVTELPQLWNVLCGDMSLVGPRPESPDRVRHYSDWQRQRLSVKPGITGLAQVHGLREQHSSEEKSRFDLQYILHWSPILDLSLILQTAWTLIARLFQGSKAGAVPLEAPAPAQNRASLLEMTHADHSQSGSD